MKKDEMNKKMKEEIKKAQKVLKKKQENSKNLFQKVMLLTWLLVLLLVDLLEKSLLV